MGESLNNADKNNVGLFKQIKTFFGQHKYIPALAVIYILFHAFFENLFRVAVVKPFLSYCTSSVLNDVIFIAILLGIVIFCIYRISKRYYISDKRIFISIILFFFLGYYRITSHVWAFESFTFWDSLKYVDVLFMFLIGDFLVKISFYLPGKKTTDNTQNKGFCFDSPLSESDKDLLNRENLVKEVCERLENTANKDASFAIGVTSEWGNGKTSFLNLIKRNLDKNRRVIIDYNPWLNSDKKSATLSFFDEMSSALKAYDSSLSNDILKYAKMLIDSSADKYANLLTTCLSLDGTPTLRERFEEINDAIKRTKLQIIVFIDDLDRLYDSEILEVLSLIRNSANFSNTIFIVAYDRNYLIAALKKVNNYHPHAYLEKIFQLELPLPQFERDIIVSVLQSKLSPYLYEEDKKELEETLSNLYIFNVDEIKTIRDANRLINSFLVSYDSLKGEIVLADLLNIELLKIKYLGVYELLAQQYSLYLTLKEAKERTYYLCLKKEEKEDSTLLEFFLKTNARSVGLNKNCIPSVISHVSKIFRNVNSSVINIRSISSPIGINRYFHYRLLNSDISTVEFSKYRIQPIEIFQNQIKKWLDENKRGIDILFKNVDFYNNIEDYENIIRALFYYASLPEFSDEYSFTFDKDILLNKIHFNNIRLFCREPSDKETFEKLIIKIYKDQPYPYKFPSDLIIEAINQGYFSFALSENQLRNILLFYFNKYTSSINKPVGETFFRLHYKCIYKMNEENDFALKIHDKVRKINKKTAKNLPDSYIKMCILKKQYGYSLMKKHILYVWGDYKYFERYIMKLDEDKVKGIKEFLTFYYQCKKEDFSPIPFEFKRFDLHNMHLFESE